MKKSFLCVAIIIEIIVAFFSLNCIIQIQNKEEVSYFIEQEHYAQETIEQDTAKTYPLELANWNIQTYKFEIDKNVWKKGKALIQIMDGKGKIIKEYAISDLKVQKGMLELDMAELVLNIEEKYSICIKNQGNSTLNVLVDEAGNLKNEQIYLFAYKKLFIILIAVLNIGFILFIISINLIKNKKVMFWIISMASGIVLMLVIPPYTAPDEMRHLARAYDIAQGNVICTTYDTKTEFDNNTFPVCRFPVELYELKLISENNGMNYKKENNSKIAADKYLDKMAVSFSGKYVEIPIHGDHTTSSVAFLPQSIAIIISEILSFPPVIMFYFVRFMNLFLAVIIAYAAFCILPKYRELFCVLFWTPGISFLRSTSSTDGFLFSLVLLFLAIVINVKYLKENVLKPKYICSLMMILVSIALIKLPYAAVVLTLLLVENEQFCIGKKENGFNKYMSITLMLGIAIGFYYISHKLLDNNPQVMSTIFASSTEINGDYISYIFKHPMKFLNMVMQTVLNSFSDYLESAVSLPASNCLVIPFIIWLMYITTKGNSLQVFSVKEKLAFMGIGCMMWFAVVLAFYFVGSSPELGYIWGMQGRYLYPVLPIFFVSGSKNQCEKIGFRKVVLIAGAFLIIHVIKIFSAYWI